MRHLRLKSQRLLLLIAAVGISMISGSAVVWTYAQESGGSGVPEGFKKSDFPAMPAAEDIGGQLQGGVGGRAAGVCGRKRWHDAGLEVRPDRGGLHLPGNGLHRVGRFGGLGVPRQLRRERQRARHRHHCADGRDVDGRHHQHDLPAGRCVLVRRQFQRGNGQFVFTDTEFFNILGPSGGVVARVAGVEHMSSGGSNFSFTFGTCEAPQD